MTPDEMQCTTCEDEGAVVWCRRVGRTEQRPATDAYERLCRMSWGDTLKAGTPTSPWGVDTCPECGRGREVGKL